MRTVTAWEMWGARKRRCSAVRRNVASIADQSLSLDRGEITSHMGGRSEAAVMINIRSRLLRVSPHQSSATMTCLATGGGAATSGSRRRNCTGAWIEFRGGGEGGV